MSNFNAMPPISTPRKQPGILAWIGFAAAVVVCVLIIKAAFLGAFQKTVVSPETAGSSIGMIARDSVQTFAVGAPAEFEGAPSQFAVERLQKTGSAAANLPTESVDQRIIKTGDLNLRVTDAAKAVEGVQKIVKDKKGFVESSSMSDPGTGPRSAWMTVRVPVDSFDAALTELKSVAVLVLNQSVNGQDVTAEFVDLEADLRNARAEEASYLEILKRSGKIEEVLAVTERLADVRGRIERLEANKRYMENRTDMSTISISMTEDTRVEVPGKTWRPYEVLKQALSDLISSLQELVNFLIRLVIAVIGLMLPIALITALVMWIGWKILKKIIRRFQK
jgi:hypothetical protein